MTSPQRDPALLIKSTPPRAIRGFLDRERLKLSRFESSGAYVTALLAPIGFGKTSQRAQRRRDALAHGALAF
jgi:LuxR family maltose regulon positive regulatory protein